MVYGRVEEKLQQLYDVAFDWMAGADAKIPTMEAAVIALSYNYRVKLPEVAVLELLADRTAEKVMDAVVDADRLDDIIKKKEERTVTTAGGSQEGSPDTSPA